MRRLLLLLGVGAVLVAAASAPAESAAAASRTWEPFVLVIGLLLVGDVAHADGTFDRAAALVERARAGPSLIYLALLGLAAVVTTLLNLDTSVAFLTPILVLAARRRGLAEEPFLFGSLFMANAASLLLPGSNLTNLIVLAREKVAGATFAARMLPSWAAAVTVTAAWLCVRYRRQLVAGASSEEAGVGGRAGCVGIAATLVAAGLVVGLRAPAVPVLVAGIIGVAVERRLGRLRATEVAKGLDLAVLAGLFGLAVGLGTLAAKWPFPGKAMAAATRWESAAIGAGASVLINNLPAAALLSARAPAHPRALLIGLNLGPNLAVTGSLSALLWYRSAKLVGCRPALRTVTRIGLTLVPCTILAALAASAVLSPTGL